MGELAGGVVSVTGTTVVQALGGICVGKIFMIFGG